MGLRGDAKNALSALQCQSRDLRIEIDSGALRLELVDYFRLAYKANKSYVEQSLLPPVMKNMSESVICQQLYGMRYLIYSAIIYWATIPPL